MAYRRPLYILITLSIALNVFFRLNSIFLSSMKAQARGEVLDNLRNELSMKVSSLYPDLNSADREKFLNVLLRESIKENRQEINAKVRKKTKELKAYFQDERGWSYLLEIDPYRWFRRINNFLNTGIFGTRRIDGRDYDDLMQAPFGFTVEPIKLHFYIGAYFYKLLHLVNNKLTLMNALAIHPVVFSAVLVIAIFGISILLGISYLGAYVVSLIIGLSPAVLLRTSFGWFDTDIYNIFMPLIITSALAYSFKGRNLKYRTFLGLAGLLTGIYSAIWSTWWLIFYILCVSLFIYKSEIILYDRKNALSLKLKESCLSMLLFIFSTYASVWLISGTQVLKASFTDPFLDISLRQNLAFRGFWPSMAPYVLELQSGDTRFLSGCVGGPLILYGGVIGLLVMFFSKEITKSKEKRFLFYAMLVWLLVSLILTWSSRRFILFFIPPVAISFGMLLDISKNFMFSRQNRTRLIKRLDKQIYNFSLSCIFIIVSIIPLYNASRFEIAPFMNDSWHNMLVKIKESTPKNSIIISWWDNGDLTMSLADRATVHCAARQHTPVSYWVARALLSPSEEESFGILRMLSSGSYRAFDELLKVLNNDKLLTLQTLKKLILLNENEGRILLSEYIKDNGTLTKIAKLIYGPPRPAYLMTCDLEVTFMNGLSSLANWDFERLLLWQAFLKLGKKDFTRYAKEELGYSQEYSESIYKTLKITDKKNIQSWISKESYEFLLPYSEHVNPPESERLILFDNELVVDRENLTAYFRKGIPPKWTAAGKVIFVSPESIKENINKDGDKKYAVLFSENNNIYKATLFSSPLADSLFFKLYFMNGRGLKHFKLIHEEYKKGFTHIFLYKIDWENKS
jgi:hypothetical protein